MWTGVRATMIAAPGADIDATNPARFAEGGTAMGVSPSHSGTPVRSGEDAWHGDGERIAVGRVPASSSRSLFCGVALAGVLGLALVPRPHEREPASADPGLLGRQPETILALAFSPDGRRLAASGYEGPVRIWDVAGRAVEASLGTEHGPAFGLAWSPDGRALAAASVRQAVTVWDARSWERAAVLEGRPGLARSLAWSPDGSTLATGGLDSDIAIWDAASWEPRAVLRGHSSAVNALAFSADGRALMSAAGDGRIRAWDAAAARPIHGARFPADSLTSVVLSPAGEAFVASRYRTVLRRDAAGNEEQVLANPSLYLAMARSPGGRALALSTGANTVEVWRLAPPTPLALLKGHASTVQALAFSPDGRMLASGDRDGTLRIWEVHADEPGPP
ncbi:translocation protein TolB [Aquisphaera giovannonii]|uniref:Translocation protein TolB n=1 Tax=Aquisphaera giovannonii TaxID=406548 RepID=A0A5B9WEQ4_9BACT|nr:WD40 repeat domain-containing protein [Aquisphaera giovannonii]QEH39062.1 translocation protein TolB [Aquisphaera giovannonii]